MHSIFHVAIILSIFIVYLFFTDCVILRHQFFVSHDKLHSTLNWCVLLCAAWKCRWRMETRIRGSIFVCILHYLFMSSFPWKIADALLLDYCIVYALKGDEHKINYEIGRGPRFTWATWHNLLEQTVDMDRTHEPCGYFVWKWVQSFLLSSFQNMFIDMNKWIIK